MKENGYKSKCKINKIGVIDDTRIISIRVKPGGLKMLIFTRRLAEKRVKNLYYHFPIEVKLAKLYRIFAIWIGYILEKIDSERIKIRFLRLLGIFERLERSPIRYLTGYFITVKAVNKQTEVFKDVSDKE